MSIQQELTKMQFLLPVTLLVIPFSFAAFVYLARTSVRPKRQAYSALATIIASPMVGFFLFGFMASGEVANPLPFQVVYTTLTALVLAGVATAWWPTKRQEPRRHHRMATTARRVI